MKGRVAIVTGASRGIGRATATILARESAKVVVNYRQREEAAEEVVKYIKETGGIALAYRADVSDRKTVLEMVRKTIDEFGGVDILVNNAGISLGRTPLSGIKEEDLDAMLRTNVKGALFCAQAVTPYMMKKHYGKIVNISSIAGLGTALPGNLLYATTKGALNILTKRLALELGPYGIFVNAVAPGLIWTDMTFGSEGHWNGQREQRIKYFEEKTMLHRIGKPEDIANTVLFLATDESNFITGQVITVDGGRIDFLTYSS